MPTPFRILGSVFLWLFCAHAVAAPFPRWDSMVAASVPLSIATAASDGRTVLVARAADAALRSTDAGNTWTAFDVQGVHPIAFLAAPGAGNVFYALTGSTGPAVDPPPRALYRSDDGGVTWQLIAPRIQTPDGQVIDYLSVGADANVIYGSRMAATICFTGLCSFDGAEGWISTDSGRTWRLSQADLTRYSHRAFAAPSDTRIAYATTVSGLFRTADQGASWKAVLLSPSVYQRQVVVDSRDARTVYVRFDNGTHLRVTEDGGETWRVSDPVDVPGPVRTLVADPLEAGRVYFVGYEGEVFESRDRARSWHRVAPSSGGALAGPTPVVGIDGARREFYASGGGVAKRISIDDASFNLGSGLWWNPAQSGWGISLTQHASGAMFGVWFTYDAHGAPIWRALPGGEWNGRIFSATIYETRGPSFFTPPFDPSKVTRTAVGRATLEFDDDNNATFSWRLDDGSAVTTRITRQLFGPPNEGQYLYFADLWWTPSESGWGVSISQQFGNVFGVWFIYDEAGGPTWLVMPDARYGEINVGSSFGFVYGGPLYTTRGPPAGTPYDPSRVTVTPAGNGAATFLSRDVGYLETRAAGRDLRKDLQRQPF